jgi:hypothetical protein
LVDRFTTKTLFYFKPKKITITPQNMTHNLSEAEKLAVSDSYRNWKNGPT